MSSQEEYEIRRALRQWQWCKEHMEKLIKLDAPKCIIAQLIIGIMVPRLIQMTGTVAECGMELGQRLGNGIAGHVGLCYICKKANATDDGICTKCLREIDEYSEKLGLDEELPE